MLKKLQHRLTLIYTLTTGIILLIVVIAISAISQINLMNKTEEEFQNLIIIISTKLQTDIFFNITWLASIMTQRILFMTAGFSGIFALYLAARKIVQTSLNPIQEAEGIYCRCLP